jgi:predicted permease
VVSFALAQELYESADRAIGQVLLVNDVELRVVAVAPPRFQGAIPNSRHPSVWLPLSMRSQVARTTPRWLTDSARLSVFARLAPNVAHGAASVIARNIAVRALPDSLARVGGVRSAEVTALRSPPPTAVREVEDGYMIFAIALVGALILAVACTNVSALLVAGAVGRRHEIAVRLAQGASRARLVRQLLTESSLLAMTGGALGLLLYWWFIRLFASNANVDLTVDVTSLTFTLAFALGTGLIFGLSPALHATRTSVAGLLRDVGGAATSRSRLQRSFVVAQIAFSQPLLVILALLLSVTIRPRDPLPSAVGDHVIATRFRSDSSERRDATDSLIRRLTQLPGVAGVVPDAAALDFRNVQRSSQAGSAVGNASRVLLTSVSPGYFDLLSVQILLGRDVSLADTSGNEQSVVIGSDVARLFWGDANPIGQRLVSVERRDRDADSLRFVVVGVVDATHPAILNDSWEMYTAHGKQWSASAFLLRTNTPAEPFMPELHKLIRSQAPSLSVSRMETLAMQHDRDRRVSLQVIIALSAAAALALVLASIGLYGVVSLAVGQRMREIGIRIAVGAAPRRVAGMFLSSGVRLGVIALVIGLPVSLVALRLGLSQGVLIAPKANLSLIGGGIAMVMLLVASAASWWPARRAVRVDPAVTLRVD